LSFGLLGSSGILAIFAAIRRASSLLLWPPDRRPVAGGFAVSEDKAPRDG